MSIRTSPAILLRSHPYSESSRILRFLTPDLGVVAVIARGVRSRSSRGQGSMESFDRGTLVFTHRPDRDLHSLRDFQPEGGRRLLGSDLGRFAGVSLLAEFLLSHTLEEGDPELFAWIDEAFVRMAAVSSDLLPSAVLAGAWRTLAHFGFPPSLDECVRCGTPIEFRDGAAPDSLPRFDVAAGGLRCVSCTADARGPRIGPGAAAQLAGFVRGDPPSRVTGAAAHLSLLESFAHHHLGERRAFRSFALLTPVFEAREEASG